MIFDPNPVETNGGTSGLELGDDNNADSALLTSLRRPVTLQRLNPSDDCLDGQWVKAILPAGDVCLPGRDFSSVTRSNDQFEALMAYFHVDRAQAYIESLGFTNVVNRQILVNADSNFGMGNDDNSFYDPSTGELSFGPGGVDDAEDADVINHEYGHAIQDSQVPGFGAGDEAGAMGEGFADYFAADMSATYTPNATFDPCIAEWDVIGSEDCLRRVDTNQTVSQLEGFPCLGEIHCLGQAWSSVLWTIRGTLGAAAADKLIIQSQYSLPANASFQDGSRVLIVADRNLNAGANQTFLENLLSSRGLLDLAHLDDTPDGATPLAVPGQASGDLDASTDVHDVFSLALTGGRGMIVKLTGAGDFDLRLYGPGTTSLYSGTVVAGSTTTGTSTESFSYLPPGSSKATYFLDVAATNGAGSYTVETISDLDGDGVADGTDNCPTFANRNQQDTDKDHLGDVCDKFPRDAANDVDHDGRGANADNCPLVANANQRDWNGNGRGDACDRSSRISVIGVFVRGYHVTFVGSMRPIGIKRNGWDVFVQRRVCRQTCAFTRPKRETGARQLAAGRIQFKFDLGRPGRYRLYARLKDPRYKRARSGFATILIAPR
jgi:hypothetical protein